MDDKQKIAMLRRALGETRDIVEEEFANLRSNNDPESEATLKRWRAAMDAADDALRASD